MSCIVTTVSQALGLGPSTGSVYGGGGGGFFLICGDLGRIFDHSFPVCAFLFSFLFFKSGD